MKLLFLFARESSLVSPLVLWKGLSTISYISLISGHSHLQCLITCSMQIWRGKAWEICSHVVMSSRQRVDTWRMVPDKESLILPVQGLEDRALARQCQYCLLFIAPGMVQHEMGIITVRHCSPCVYPLST